MVALAEFTCGRHAQITTEGQNSWPTAVPDGRSMVYVSSRGEGTALGQIGLDGQNARSILSATSAAFPAVTPDGKWIFFASSTTGVETLWKVGIDGGAPTQIFQTVSTRPSISPDGRQVAFLYQESKDAPFVLAVMPIDGDRPTLTFRVFPSTSFSTIRWTADGKALLHNMAERDRSNIWLQPLSGGPLRQLTHFADQNIHNFDRSTDGKRLIIARGILSRDAVLIRNFR